MVASDIGFHHTDGGQVFLNDAVDLVNRRLHQCIKRAHAPDDLKQQHAEQRHSHQEHKRQLRVDREGDDRRRQHHRRRAKRRPYPV